MNRREFIQKTGTAGLSAWALSRLASAASLAQPAVAQAAAATGPARVAADPLSIPAPIKRNQPIVHDVTLEAKHMTAEIEPGVTFNYMTFGGQIPGPMIRVRQGDTVNLTVKNPATATASHNVDLHAVYGPGGGAADTMVAPGESKSIRFKAMYPGAFIYHCAAPLLDYHISSGMYGMIVVEPPEGLPPVDHEFYLGQNEVYTDKEPGKKGAHNFNFQAMWQEDPTYVLLNGAKHALTSERYGPIDAKVGETARVFFVNGGPNLMSSFHPIGNVWTKAWREGALLSQPERYVQTLPVSPGSTAVCEMEFPVAGPVKIVDHALSRVTHRGMLGIIQVSGNKNPEIYTPTSS